MSDVMLIGVLRMPIPDNPDPLTLNQFVSRARQAADRIESDAAKLKELSAEVERLRADAERYRWLRGPLIGRGIRVVMPTPYPAILSGAELDREIDAALKEGQR